MLCCCHHAGWNWGEINYYESKRSIFWKSHKRERRCKPLVVQEGAQVLNLFHRPCSAPRPFFSERHGAGISRSLRFCHRIYNLQNLKNLLNIQISRGVYLWTWTINPGEIYLVTQQKKRANHEAIVSGDEQPWHVTVEALLGSSHHGL